MTCIESPDVIRIYHGIAIDIQRQLTANLSKPRKRIIVLAGPTGVGKSTFAMNLAQLIGGEIVSADCMQVYCGMDIGTAKPSIEDRLTVPHHLIDIRHVRENFNVTDFYYEARQSFQIIHMRDNVSIVAGARGFICIL